MVKVYGIVIIPSREASNLSRESSAFLATQRETCFVLGTQENVPHVSLYHFSAEEDVIEDVITVMHNVLSISTSFSVQFDACKLIDGRWIFATYELGEQLLDLHQTVLDHIAPLRTRGGEADLKEDWYDASEIRKENLELYGWSEVRSLYQPHLTLTRLAKKTDESFLGTLPAQDFSFEVTKLGLYELGKYGTCKKLVREFIIDSP